MLILPQPEIRIGDVTDARRVGANGRNGFWSIWVFNGISRPAAVLMQEIREWRYKFDYGRLLGLLLVELLLLTPAPIEVKLFLAPALFMLGYVLFTRIPHFMRLMEIRGHAVEIVVGEWAYGYNRSTLIYSEARGLAGYKQFKGYDVEDIIDMLDDALEEAEDWAKRHEDLVQKWVLRLPDKTKLL